MASRPTSAEAIGMLPKNDERPPLFAYAVSLYRADLLFRGLIDLAVTGLVILAFMGGLAAAFAPVKSAVTSAVSILHRPASEIGTGTPPMLTGQDRGPGAETILAIQSPQIPDWVIERTPQGSVVALKDARRHLAAREPELALALLAAADQSEPSILYARAIATLHLGGEGRGIEVQKLLRGATAKAFAPAFTLNGLVLFRLLAKSERGELPDKERLSLDGSGRAVTVTNAQLAAEALLWWQRGAAFHDAEAMRLLGMAEARGFNGKRNIPAAIAYWRDAAGRGDALARFELAQLYFEGVGVEADSEKAYALFRQAADQGVLRAGLALGAALISKGITGDVDSTREALRVLDVVARESTEPEERAFAHYVIGTYLFEAGPAALRDPKRALNHFRLARGRSPEAMRSLARAFETGVGAERDLVKAIGYLALAKTSDAQAEADFTRLLKTLSSEEVVRTKSFRLADDAVPSDFAAQYRPVSNPGGSFKPVSSSF
jgi:TPR repeat protein